METLIILKEVAKILLLVGAFGLCVVVAWGLVRLFPHLRRVTENLATTAEAASKIGGDLAVVSSDVAGDVRKTAASTAEAADGLVGMFPILRHTADNLANTTEATSKIAGNFTAVSADVASSVRKTAVSTAEGAEHFAQTGRNALNLFPHLRRVTDNLATAAEAASKVGGDFAAVSADVASDVRKTAASTAAGAERLATTADAASKIGGDFAAVSADVAGDVRKTAASTAAGAEHLATSAGVASKIGGDFAAVSVDVARDVRRTAASTATGVESLATTADAASKIGEDFAAVSADVAGDVQKTAASTAEGAAQLVNAVGAASKIGGDFAAVSADVAGDVRRTTASTAAGADRFAQTGRNVMEASHLLQLLGPAGRAANLANMGISRIPGMVRDLLGRGRA